MVEVSKMLFDAKAGDLKCHELIHPWSEGCARANCILLVDSIMGSYKFYAVLYAVQLLIRGKKINRKYLRKQLICYLKSGVFGFLVGTSFATFNCIFMRLFFKKFHYYNTAFLPSFLSGVCIYFEPPHRRYLVVNTFFNLVLEFWVRTLEFKGLIRRSNTRETLLFMFGSAYLFYLMRQEKDKGKNLNLLWFFTPPKVNKETVPNNGYISAEANGFPSYCPHSKSCEDYIIKGTLQMFGVGCAMTMLRKVVPKLGTPVKAIKSIRGKDFKLGLFLGGYIGIYRFITCFLCQYYRKDSARHAIPAGFLAGSAFWFNPSLSISLAGITNILHILCGRMYDNKLLPEKAPLPELLYALCQGLLFHARIMHPDSCPRYIFNLTDTVTSGRVKEVHNVFMKFLNV